MKTKTMRIPVPLLLLLAMIFGCTKEEPIPAVSTPQSSKNMYVNETYLIEPRDGGGSYTFSIDNTFVASVDEDGLVKAKKVGNAAVKVSAAVGSTDVAINVLPRINLYNEPINHWGLSRSQIISDLGQPYATTDNLIAYKSSTAAVDFYGYYFSGSNIVEASYVIVYSVFSSQLADFLSERYLAIGTDNDFIYMINGNDNHSPNLIVTVGVYSSTRYIILYMPYSASKTSAFTDVFNYYHQLISSIL